jgi:hypothetical protein
MRTRKDFEREWWTDKVRTTHSNVENWKMEEVLGGT